MQTSIVSASAFYRTSGYLAAAPGLRLPAAEWKEVGRSRKRQAAGRKVGSRMPPLRRSTCHHPVAMCQCRRQHCPVS